MLLSSRLVHLRPRRAADSAAGVCLVLVLQQREPLARPGPLRLVGDVALRLRLGGDHGLPLLATGHRHLATVRRPLACAAERRGISVSS